MPATAVTDLNELANAPGGAALLSMGDHHLLYVGPMRHMTPHALGASVLLTAIDRPLRFRTAGTPWVECRGAFIPAGVAHEMDFCGGRMAALAVEPGGGVANALRSRLRDVSAHGGALIGRSVDAGNILRDIDEDHCDLADAWDWLCEWTRLDRQHASVIEPRIASVIDQLRASPDDASSAESWAHRSELSVSRFLHLFVEVTGVPFRRYRLWNRVRSAVDLGSQGHSMTDAALSVGFSDSAHFSRTFRGMLGITPTAAMSNVSRAVRVD